MFKLINIPLATKGYYTDIEREYFKYYWKRYNGLFDFEISANEIYSTSEIPYWAISIASYCKSRKISVEIYDFQSEKPTSPFYKNSLGEIARFAKCIGISCNTNNYFVAVDTLRAIKKCNPDCLVVLGGPHASNTDKLCIADGFDYVVRGIGEIPFFMICSQTLNKEFALEEIPNLSYANNSVIYRTPNITYRQIKEIIISNWRNLDFDLYKGKPDIVRLFTSFGCPYNCSFCADTIWKGKGVVYLEKEVIEGHINQLIHKYQPRYILIGEENFTTNVQHMKSVSRILKKANLPFICQSRVDLINNEVVEILMNSGCILIALGIETADDTILEQIAKKITFNKSINALKILQNKIPVLTYWLIGLPNETKKSAVHSQKKIVELLNEKLTYLADYYINTPYPGTKLYSDPIGFNIAITYKDFKMWREDSVSVLKTKDLSEEDIYLYWLKGLSQITNQLKINAHAKTGMQ